MEKLILNETPVRTSKNFNINNIKLQDIDILRDVDSFDNLEIIKNTSKITVEENLDKIFVAYGISDILLKQSNDCSNKNIKVIIDSHINKDILFNYKFDKNNVNLIDTIKIVANKKSRATIVLKYESESDICYYHNQLLKVVANEDSNINIIILNFLNTNSNHFLTIDNEILENANLTYTIVDFGSKSSITNYYSNLIGKKSGNSINTIYLGEGNEMFDLNYIAHLRGEKSNVNIEVEGALKDNSKKHFKGTIDFKKGAKKSIGNEHESCTLLSDKAKSIALPMLLCSEEDVEGNHSSSAGKISDKELFYIMSRGFNKKEAMKLMVKAKFNKIIQNIKNEEIQNIILEKIDKKLD